MDVVFEFQKYKKFSFSVSFMHLEFSTYLELKWFLY